MPFWVFTLGKYIFDQSNIQMPYLSISGSALGLIIPLTIGIFIQKQSPRLTKILLKILKPLSLIMIILLSIFATIVNFYIFKMFTWHVSFVQ
jgi:solute carrier family 10 (sodium/bile acid cotransporter), member 3/5